MEYRKFPIYCSLVPKIYFSLIKKKYLLMLWIMLPCASLYVLDFPFPKNSHGRVNCTYSNIWNWQSTFPSWQFYCSLSLKGVKLFWKDIPVVYLQIYRNFDPFNHYKWSDPSERSLVRCFHADTRTSWRPMYKDKLSNHHMAWLCCYLQFLVNELQDLVSWWYLQAWRFC